jgi:hypothetical protein
MKKTRLQAVSGMVLAILLAIPAGMALAKELGGLTISGPGIQGTLTMDDPEAMRELEQTGFLEPSKSVNLPKGLGEGYILTILLNLEDGPQPWIRVAYYPGQAGQSSYFNFVYLMEGSINKPGGEWYLAEPKVESALRELLGAHGVAFAVPEPAPKADPNQLSAIQSQVQPALSSEAGPIPISSPALNPGKIWGLGILAIVLLVLASLRWLKPQQKAGTLKQE